VIRKTTQDKPSHATHWNTRSMAEAAGLSEKSVRRIWHQHGLKPHLARSFKVSNDPQFAEKLEAIIGLYLNPPEHAMVLCADEKSQIETGSTIVLRAAYTALPTFVCSLMLANLQPPLPERKQPSHQVSLHFSRGDWSRRDLD
jgi:hypothetical protein